jgi:hypothetical protein
LRWDGSAGGIGQRDVQTPVLAAKTPADRPDDALVAVPANLNQQPVPGSMQAELLATTAENRDQMLRLAISDAGFHCPAGAKSKAVGTSGGVWRVHCGEADVYWVEIDEFGHLLVRPAPYSDFGWDSTPVVPQDRTLELIEPR